MASPCSNASPQIKDKLESYFENANSTSRRMMVDISDYKKKVNWNYLNENQQADFLWENLISKKAGSAYGDTQRPIKDVQEIFTTLKVNSGEKIVIDEDTSNGRPFGCSWRDEHSAPFSWHTKSQLDLRVVGVDEVDKNPSSTLKEIPQVAPEVKPQPTEKKSLPPTVSGAPARPKKGLKPIDTPKRRPPPPPPPQTPKVVPQEVPSKNTPSTTTPKLVLAGGALVMIQEPVQEEEKAKVQVKERPKEAPPQVKTVPTPKEARVKPQEPVRESVLSIDDLDKNIPKTGFDFLDNW